MRARVRQNGNQILRTVIEEGGLSDASSKNSKEVFRTSLLPRRTDSINVTAIAGPGKSIARARTITAESLLRTVGAQQECESGIPAEPHCCAMCLQHSCSAGVRSVRSRQANAGADSSSAMLNQAPNLRNHTILKVYVPAWIASNTQCHAGHLF